jgi:hypothetical protein
MKHFMLISAVAMFCLGSAAAGAAELRGTYASTGNQTCIVASGGFNSALQAIGTTYSTTSTEVGITTYKADGTGSFNSTSMTLVPPPTVGFFPSGSTSQSSSEFTFSVTGNTFTSENVPGTDVGTVLTGTLAGQTFKTAGIPNRTGHISADGRTVVAATVTPSVETQTFSSGEVHQQLCFFNRVFIKID